MKTMMNNPTNAKNFDVPADWLISWIDESIPEPVGYRSMNQTLAGGSRQLEMLQYDPAWLESGFLDIDFLQEQIAVYQSGEDPNTEHYRCAAFRNILLMRDKLTDTEIALYIQLAQLDGDIIMAQSMLMELLLWRGLTAEQFETLTANPLFAEPLYQKRILRKRLFSELKTTPISYDLFERCLLGGDSIIQRELVERQDLTPEQLILLAEQGGNRAIRNIAQVRLRMKRSATQEALS